MVRGTMSLTTGLIILLSVVLFDLILVRSANAFFARYPLEQSGFAPVRVFGRPSMLLTFIKIVIRQPRHIIGALRRLNDFRLSALLLLLGAAGVTVGQSMRYAEEPRSWLSLLFIFGGMAVFTVGVLLVNNPLKVFDLLETPARWLIVRPWQAFLLIASLALSFATAVLAGDGMLMRHPVAAVVCYLAALAAVVAGAWQMEAGPRPSYQNALIFAAGMALIALPLRTYGLDSIPRVLNGDEGSFGMAAVEVIKGQVNNIFGMGWYSFPLVSFSVLTIPIQLLGQTALAVRLVSAIAGALTVGALYLLGRRLFDHPTALAASFFLAVLHFHIHFSRLAVNNIWDGLSYVAVLACLWAGWRDEKRLFYVLGGVMLGFSQYFYTSSRMLFLMLPVFLAGLALRDRLRFRRAIPHLAVLALVAGVIMLPLGSFYLKHPDEFMAPMNRVSLDSEWFRLTARDMQTTPLGVMLNQFTLSIRAYTDVNMRMWYDSRTPMLLTIPAVFFFLGMALILARKRWAQAWMLFCWLGIITLTGALSQDTPAAQRYVAAAPAVALLVGYAVVSAADLLRQLAPQWGRLWLALTIALMAWIGWNEYRQYFINYTPRSYFDENTLTANYLADYLADKPAGTELCFFGMPQMGFFSINSLPFLAPHIEGRDCEYPWPADNPAPAGDPVYVFLPHMESTFAQIKAQYPGGMEIEIPGIERPVLIWIYDLTEK